MVLARGMKEIQVQVHQLLLQMRQPLPGGIDRHCAFLDGPLELGMQAFQLKTDFLDLLFGMQTQFSGGQLIGGTKGNALAQLFGTRLHFGVAVIQLEQLVDEAQLKVVQALLDGGGQVLWWQAFRKGAQTQLAVNQLGTATGLFQLVFLVLAVQIAQDYQGKNGDNHQGNNKGR